MADALRSGRHYSCVNGAAGEISKGIDMHEYHRLLADRISVDGEYDLWNTALPDHGDTTLIIRHGGYCSCGRFVPVGRVCEECLDAAEALAPTDMGFGRAAVVAFIVAALGAVVWFAKEWAERVGH